MPTSRRAVLLLTAVVVAYLAWGAHYISRTSFVHDGERVFTLWDDAMISMQYARNLRNGEGLVWIAGGERVQGFTNPGVTLVMAAAQLAPVSAVRISLGIQLLALALLGATVVMIWGIARRVYPDDEWLALAAALSSALCAPVAVWGLQGSDVAFMACWLAGSVYLLAGRNSSGTLLLGVLAIGLWIRPDAALFYVPLLVCAAFSAGGGGRSAWIGAFVLAGTWAAQGIGSQLYYGDPLPNTYYLKATGAPRALALASGLSELLPWLPYLAVPVGFAVAALRRAARSPVVVLCGVLFVLAQAYNTWVGGDFIFGYGSRFVAPTLPLLLLLVVAGCRRVLARFTSERFLASGRGVAAFLLACAFLAVLSNLPLATMEWLDPGAPTMHRGSNQNNFRFARYLESHTDADTTLGAHWGGVPVYFSGRPAIDVLGKSDRHIAKLEVDRFTPGHSKWDWDYVLRERKPDILRAPSRGLGERQDFRRDYLKVVTNRGLGFFIRRDRLAKLHDPSAVFVDLTTGRRLRRAPIPGRTPPPGPG